MEGKNVLQHLFRYMPYLWLAPINRPSPAGAAAIYLGISHGVPHWHWPAGARARAPQSQVSRGDLRQRKGVAPASPQGTEARLRPAAGAPAVRAGTPPPPSPPGADQADSRSSGHSSYAWLSRVLCTASLPHTLSASQRHAALRRRAARLVRAASDLESSPGRWCKPRH
jgi:hypothetical protein